MSRKLKRYCIITRMSEVLYRKYRPQRFSEVLGQESVISALEGALAQDKVAHAYLFAGSRGTGKTSVARILARALDTNDADLYEIDAASHRQIDDIRALNEAIAAAPFASRYKVYILDEVHMLTPPAWNALLKTLEEPPPHAVFILATTELEKVPETVISRCQVFSFKKPSQKVLKETVERIAKKEGYAIEPAAAELVALLAEGSYRDAQGILQKVINAAADKKITLANVERVTGAPKSALIQEVVEAIEKKDTESGLGAIAEAVRQNHDMKVFAKMLLARLRFILLLRNAPTLASEIETEVSGEEFALLKQCAGNYESRINSAVLLEFLNAFDLIGVASLPQLPLELAVIKLCG